MIEPIGFTLNGNPVRIEVDPGRTLLWVLRNDFGLTGAKYGCGEGLCGACTVLVDEEALPACQLAVGFAQGKRITTIEGLAADGRLHPLQEAFVQHEALQCGFCTPGMILKAHGLLAANPSPSRGDIIAELDGNLCRCGAHVRIIDAVQTAARVLKGGRP